MKRVCFVDDAKEEVLLFTHVFEKSFDLLAICASTFNEVQNALSEKNEWKPELFILDLYFPVAVEDQASIEKRVSQLPASEFPPDDGNMVKSYLNYVAAERRLEEVLGARNQSYEGGLNLARKIREANAYRKTPIIFYSRKATCTAISKCSAQDGVYGVVKKPTAGDWRATTALTKNAKPQLIDLFEEIAARSEADLRVMRRFATQTLKALEIASGAVHVGRVIGETVV